MKGGLLSRCVDLSSDLTSRPPVWRLIPPLVPLGLSVLQKSVPDASRSSRRRVDPSGLNAGPLAGTDTLDDTSAQVKHRRRCESLDPGVWLNGRLPFRRSRTSTRLRLGCQMQHARHGPAETFQPCRCQLAVSRLAAQPPSSSSTLDLTGIRTLVELSAAAIALVAGLLRSAAPPPGPSAYASSALPSTAHSSARLCVQRR
jgi:hypothetical protein